MNYKQNEKINQVKESTLVVGIDIGSTTQYARAFDWRGIELGKGQCKLHVLQYVLHCGRDSGLHP